MPWCLLDSPYSKFVSSPRTFSKIVETEIELSHSVVRKWNKACHRARRFSAAALSCRELIYSCTRLSEWEPIVPLKTKQFFKFFFKKSLFFIEWVTKVKNDDYYRRIESNIKRIEMRNMQRWSKSWQTKMVQMPSISWHLPRLQRNGRKLDMFHMPYGYSKQALQVQRIHSQDEVSSIQMFKSSKRMQWIPWKKGDESSWNRVYLQTCPMSKYFLYEENSHFTVNVSFGLQKKN